jgi:hypothetical protein
MKMKRLKYVLMSPLVLAAMLFFLNGCKTQEKKTAMVHNHAAMMPAVVEETSPKPYPNAQWVQGYWARMDDTHCVWVHGYWK